MKKDAMMYSTDVLSVLLKKKKEYMENAYWNYVCGDTANESMYVTKSNTVTELLDALGFRDGKDYYSEQLSADFR